MAELSEKRQKFIQTVASNPNASQTAKNIAAKYAASAGTTVQSVAAQPKTTTTTGGVTTTTGGSGATTTQIGPSYFGSYNPNKKTTTASIISRDQTTTGDIATGGTPKDVGVKTTEEKVVTQPISGGGGGGAIAKSGVVPKPPVQPIFPTGTQGLRATAEKFGLPVGFDLATGQVSIGGKAVDVSELRRDAQGNYYGTPEQIQRVINTSGTPPTGTQSLREAFAGRDVQYSPETGVVVDGVPIDTSNLPMVGDRFYVTPAQSQALATQIDQMKSEELKAQDKIKEIQAQQTEELAKLEKQKEEALTGLKDYKSLITDDFISTIRSVFGNPFQYDPNADRSLQQAQIYAERQLREQLNARGILSSTMTRDQLGSLYAELVPKYESIAFDRYNQNVDNMLKQAYILRQLSQDDYVRYKDFVTASINSIDEVSKNTIQQAKNNIDTINDALVRQETARQNESQRKIAQYNAALSRFDKMGFADDETARLLNIPVNTPSEQIKRLLLQKKLEEENSINDYKRRIEEKRIQTELDKEEIDYEYEKKAPDRALAREKFEEEKRAARARESIDTARELRLQKEGQVTVQGQTFKKSPYFNMIYDKINNEIQTEREDEASKIIVRGASGQIVKNWYQTPGSADHKRILTQVMKNPSLNDLEKTLILDDNNIPYSVDILRDYGIIK